MTKKEIAHWWRSHFSDAEASRPQQQLQAQVDGVERFLGLEPRARILDLACGAGSQTLELARRSYRILGLDAQQAPLNEARHAARQERLNVHFLKSELSQIPYRAEFDAVVSLFASLGALAAERDDQRVLEAVRKALKPGAKLLIDLLNKEWLMRHFEPHFWEEEHNGRGAVALNQVSFNFETGRLDNHRTIVAKDGTRSASFVSLRVYTLTEIKSLLSAAGLQYRQAWGGFDGAAYGMDSPRMIVLAERREESRPVRRVERELVSAIRIKGRRKAR